MIARTALLIILAFLPALSGCTTVVGERRKSAIRERSDIETLKSDMQRLRGQVAGIVTAQQDLYREIEALRESGARDRREFSDRLTRMERNLAAYEAALEKVRQQVVSDLSTRMAEIMRSHGSRSSRGEEGYEHIVRPGETLSEIAAAYNVRADVIVKANNLKNPNSIRAGQKLFIPE